MRHGRQTVTLSSDAPGEITPTGSRQSPPIFHAENPCFCEDDLGKWGLGRQHDGTPTVSTEET